VDSTVIQTDQPAGFTVETLFQERTGLTPAELKAFQEGAIYYPWDSNPNSQDLLGSVDRHDLQGLFGRVEGRQGLKIGNAIDD
jgi:hypothetical protein